MRINQLTFYYPKAKQPLFTNLNWQLAEGKVNVLIGPNGAGKTTLLDLISGSLHKKGSPVIDSSPDNIVYQLQGVPMLSTMTGRHYIALLFGADGGHASATMDDVFPELTEEEREQLADLWTKEYGLMSPGERRWLMIQCYVHYERQLYLFDESTAGVDRRNARLILKRINDLAKTKHRTVIYTTHLANDISNFSSPQIFLLEQGTLQALGSLQECKARLTTDDRYPFLHDFFDENESAHSEQ
ncbi:MAG: ATP-binding cassette domain-containing protein [Sporolactobacillus sp.]